MHNDTNNYYKKNGIEAIDVIDAFELNFSLGNVIKYVLRAGRKDSNTRIQDLQKASDYLKHEINKLIAEKVSKELINDDAR